MGRNRTNYNNKYNPNKEDRTYEDFSKEENVEVVEEVKEEIKPDPEPYEEPIENATTVVLGKVDIPDNKMLNVRAEPSIDSDPVATINAHSEIVILDSNSNVNWHKICTAAGIEGYVLKDYVTGIHNTII